jgi:import inner membrane translocase subunit TIM44
MDPNFCKEAFLKECERDLIPNILEAFVRGDLAILEDWCYEAPFNIMATPIRQAIQLGYTFHSQILDIDEVDLVMGKMTENGPVLALTFTAQMIECLKDMKGKIFIFILIAKGKMNSKGFDVRFNNLYVFFFQIIFVFRFD